MLKKRLARLEQLIFQREHHRVIMVRQERNQMAIPELEFTGTVEEGRQFMEQYPNCAFIIDDIPRGEADMI